LNPSVLKGDFDNETILIQLVSHSRRVRYAGGVSRRRLHMANGMK